MAELYSIVLGHRNHLPRFHYDLFEKEGTWLLWRYGAPGMRPWDIEEGMRNAVR